MAALPLTQTPGNAESATIRMVVRSEAGKPNAATQRSQNTNLLQYPTRNQPSPYPSHIRADLPLNNHPSSSNPPQVFLHPMCSHPNFRLRSLPARRATTRMLRIRSCHRGSTRRWPFHLRTRSCTAITLQRTLVHIRILQSLPRNQRLGHQWLPKHHPHQLPHNRSCPIPIMSPIPPNRRCITTPRGMVMAGGITREGIRTGADPLRIHLLWMASVKVLVCPLLEGTPKRVRVQQQSPREAFFRSHFRTAPFFVYFECGCRLTLYHSRPRFRL